MGSVLLWNKWRSVDARWAGLTLFVGGIGNLSNIIDELMESGTIQADAEWARVIFLGYETCSLLYHYGLPYAYINFCLDYTKFFGNRMKRVISYGLAIPLLILLGTTPIYPMLQFNYLLLSLWAGCTLLPGSALLVYCYLKEVHPFVKKERLQLLFCLPIVIWVLFADYILFTNGEQLKWIYMDIIKWLFLITLFFLAAKYGIMGVKLRFKQQNLNHTLHTVSSATQMMNHCMKTEISIISMCVNNICNHPAAKNLDIQENVALIMKATDHLLAMMARLRDQSEDIKLNLQAHRISVLADKAIQVMTPYFSQQQITLSRNYSCDAVMLCDNVQVHEVLVNLFSNAVEAMKSGGKLYIEIYRLKGGVTLSVRDTGVGIPERHFGFIVSPFFTTKDRKTNFGLGLSYVYKVMQAHNGSMEILSKEGKGTAVLLHFPKRKLLDLDRKVSLFGREFANDKPAARR
ncbi:HAMP domain-containing histidine kinase [Paenibacillus sp. WST5]|uniref:histidine kinase n=2 Tax=Paenibacillus sedimenti TaxID=2770274 RepID=A0A926KNZ0_9BACL|nr:HAMP domain-containing histidine kinase [Paenibacillus sedimenti]